MTTYRTEVASELGRWKLAIVREPGEVVAVVLKGGEDFAEHICALLNRDHTPDVDHTNGAREALDFVRRRFKRQWPGLADVADSILRDAAAELGLDEEAPGSRLGTPVAAENASAVGRGANDDPKPAEGECDCGHEGLDAMFHLTPCPVAVLRIAARRLGYRLTLKDAQ